MASDIKGLKRFTARQDTSDRCGSYQEVRAILQLLDVAGKPADMNIAGFRFHHLPGNPKRWSVRVTGNYRITFGWSGENALDVDFEDYH